jgi:hypothetical protein
MERMKFIVNQPKPDQGILNTIGGEEPYIPRTIFGEQEEGTEITNVAADGEQPYVPPTLQSVIKNSSSKNKGADKPEVNSSESGEEPYVPPTLQSVINNKKEAD